MMRISIFVAVAFLAAGAWADPAPSGTVSGGATPNVALPNPAKTCQDFQAYVGPDSTMSLDSYGQLLIAAGKNTKDTAAVHLNAMRMLLINKLASELKAPLNDDVTLFAHGSCDKGACQLSKIRFSGC